MRWRWRQRCTRLHKRLPRVAFAVHIGSDMKRSITSSVLVFLITALVGTALTAHADAKGATQPAQQASGAIYWAQ